MPKRTFNELRNLVLLQLSKGRKTINTLCRESGISWKTLERHLTYLAGKGMVAEVFNSPYVRIFELTEKGKSYLEQQPKGAVRFARDSDGNVMIL